MADDGDEAIHVASESRLAIPAWAYQTASNIERGVLPYGEDVIHSAPPYHDPTPDHSWHMFAEYYVGYNSYVTYVLWVEYAAETPRPCYVHWDGVMKSANALRSRTGGWFPVSQRWENQMIVLTGGSGIHRLRISRDGPIPHIRNIRLELL